MTKRELIFTVFEKLNITSDDADITQEFISSLIDNTRAKLIKQTYGNKNWNIPIELRQELCMTLSPVSAVNGLSCSGTILRTNEVVPKGISVKGGDGSVLRIKRYDRSALQINIVPIERLPLIGHNTFTAQLTYGAIDSDRRVYILSGSKKHTFLEKIKIEGIYERPDDIWEMKCYETQDADAFTVADTDQVPCEPWDEEYPIEASMVDDMIAIILKDLAPTLSIPKDELNDADNARG